MAEPHWHTDENTYGCQHPHCTQPATHMWNRAATAEEIATESDLPPGPYGTIHRNPNGPHATAVFSCPEHAPHLDAAALFHDADCPAPDHGCDCD